MEGVEGAKGTTGSRIKKTFRALDAFPKVEDEYQTRSVAGAAGTDERHEAAVGGAVRGRGRRGAAGALLRARR